MEWRQIVRRAKKAKAAIRPSSQPTQRSARGQVTVPHQRKTRRTRSHSDQARSAEGKTLADVLGQVRSNLSPNYCEVKIKALWKKQSS